MCPLRPLSRLGPLRPLSALMPFVRVHSQFCMRPQCLGENQMTLVCFFRSYTIERLLHSGPAVYEFIAKRCPHLQDRVRKTKLKNRTGDGWIGALITKIDVLPRLDSAWFILHDLERARIFGGEGHRSLRSHNL
jgi:hypothetical protein